MPHLIDQYQCLAIALSERDAYTGAHCDRVVGLAQDLARFCSIGSHELGLLHVASQFHDIGKIGVPDAVLLKPDALTTTERLMIQSHSALGQRICATIPHEDMPEIGSIIRHHHEGYDGSGYPDGVGGEDIPALARILSIADCYDAMATARPYHRARSHDEVMTMMHAESGQKFDPYLFRKFNTMIAHSDYRALPA